MLKSILVVVLLMASGSAMAKSVDWTPYLKGMQESCDINYGDLVELFGDGKKSKMPKKLQPSVAKYMLEPHEKTSVQLKNATAFGQPITRIVFEHPETSYVSLTVYFANSNFTKIKPQLFLKLEDEKYSVGTNKAWSMLARETSEMDEHGYPIVKYSHSPISIKQAQVIKNSRKNGGDYGKFDGLAYIDNNGWFRDIEGGEGESSYSGLSFDVKKKSVMCGYGM